MGKTTTQPDSLLPCPLCGRKLNLTVLLRPDGEPSKFCSVWCPDNDCPLSLDFQGLTSEQAIERANKRDSELWHEFMHPELMVCSLCGNTGLINTAGRAVSHAGIPCGGLWFCICPNGRERKKKGDGTRGLND